MNSPNQPPGTFFDSGSAKLNADGKEMPVTRAQELGNLPDKMSIEGHTDSMPYAPLATHGNWELSDADRAHPAPRVMQGNGIQGRPHDASPGIADQRLHKPDSPLDPSNRRISLIVQCIVKNNDEEGAKASGKSDPHDQNKMPSPEQRPNPNHQTPWTGSGSAV